MRFGTAIVMLATLTLFDISAARASDDKYKIWGCPAGQVKDCYHTKTGSYRCDCVLPPPPKAKEKTVSRQTCLKNCRDGCGQKYAGVPGDLKRCSAGCSSECAQ